MKFRFFLVNTDHVPFLSPLPLISLHHIIHILSTILLSLMHPSLSHAKLRGVAGVGAAVAVALTSCGIGGGSEEERRRRRGGASAVAWVEEMCVCGGIGRGEGRRRRLGQREGASAAERTEGVGIGAGVAGGGRCSSPNSPLPQVYSPSAAMNGGSGNGDTRRLWIRRWRREGAADPVTETDPVMSVFFLAVMVVVFFVVMEAAALPPSGGGGGTAPLPSLSLDHALPDLADGRWQWRDQRGKGGSGGGWVVASFFCSLRTFSQAGEYRACKCRLQKSCIFAGLEVQAEWIAVWKNCFGPFVKNVLFF